MSIQDILAKKIYKMLLDEAIWDLCFHIHRRIKVGHECNCPFCAFNFGIGDPTQHSVPEDFEDADEAFLCDFCSRPISASKYAPHLNKDMDRGRNTNRSLSRQASIGMNAGGSQSDSNDGEIETHSA